MRFPIPVVSLLVFLKPFSCSVFDLRAINEKKSSIVFEKNSPVVIKGGSEEFRAIGAKREEEPKPSEPEPISQPSDYARIFIPAIAIPPPPKRARSTSSAFALYPSLTTAEIIEQEVKTCGYIKAEKRQAFRQALETIAANDIDKFIADKNELLKTFKTSYVYKLEKNGAKDFLVKYMVLFGADKFFDKFGRSHVKVAIEMDVFRYLIETKPLDCVLNVLLGFSQIAYTEELIQEISAILHAKYPAMGYFRKLAIRMLRTDFDLDWSGRILTARSELEAFMQISSEYAFSYNSHELMSQVPFERPDLYVQSSSSEKFNFIRMIIHLDDLDKFEGILRLDPEMVNHTYKCGYSLYEDGSYNNMMDTCILSGATKCFACLLDIYPEMINSKTLKRAVNEFRERIAGILDGLLEKGFGNGPVIEGSDGKQYSLIQYAFSERRSDTLNHFVIRLGAERVKTEINAMWPTKESIAFHVLGSVTSRCYGMIDFMLDVLGIKATDRFTHEGIIGDIAIFYSGPNDYLRSRLFR